MGMEIKRECAVGDQMGMEIECPRSNVRDQMSGDQMSRDQMRTTRLGLSWIIGLFHGPNFDSGAS